VDQAELLIDTLGDDSTLRYLITLYFVENPVPKEASPEQTMISRVFDEIPKWASLVLSDLDKVMSILSGESKPEESDWMLQDEFGLPVPRSSI